MKKLIAISVAFALVASASFAQITFKGSGSGLFSPLTVDKKDGKDADLYAGVERGNGDNFRVTFDVIGDTERAGFRFGMRGDSDKGVEIHDFAHVWIKPFSMLKLNIGKFNEDFLRGKIGDSNFSRYVGPTGNNNDIFTRFQGTGRSALITLTPIDGLFIGAIVHAGTDFMNSHKKASDVYQSIQVGAGYEISNIGLARIQFIGNTLELVPAKELVAIESNKINNPIMTANAMRMEAAFAYTGMEGLIVDFGIKIPFAITKENRLPGVKETYQQAFQASLGATYKAGPLSIMGRLDTRFAENYKKENLVGPKNETIRSRGFASLGFYLNPSYNLDFMTVGLDFALNYISESKTKDSSTDHNDGGLDVGFGLWAQKNFANSFIKAGITAKMPTERTITSTARASKAFQLFVPIYVSVSF